MSSIEALEFTVDSQLLGELGEKLVTNNYIALAELIKNSYDADSTEITISFDDVTKPPNGRKTSQITVSDNGCGMSLKEVELNWMRIATANKLYSPLSPRYGRAKTGNKGIGRFACQRLAEILILETTAQVKSEYQTTTVTFDWSSFKPGTDVDNIPCKFATKKSKAGRTGTTLKLIGVRDVWTQRDYSMLQKNIALLSIASATKRGDYEEDLGFSIFLKANEFSDEEINLQKRYLESGWGSLRGKVNTNGSVDLTLKSLGSSNKKFNLPGKFSPLNGLSFEINFLPGTKDIENRRNPTLLTKELLSKILDAHSGIRLYLDDFRVYPYGDPGDDWLNIDRDVSRRHGGISNEHVKAIAEEMKLNTSRAMLNHPRNGNLIGAIHISRLESNPFSIKMDREGLVENTAFQMLRRVIRDALEWLTIQYEAFRLVEKRKQKERTEAEFDQILNTEDSGDKNTKVQTALDFLTKAAKSEIDSPTTRTESKQLSSKAAMSSAVAVSTAAELVKQKLEESEAELAILRSVAATGPLMFVFAHEIKGITGYLSSNATFLDSIANRITDKTISNEINKASEHLRETKSRFDQLNRFFNVFSNTQKIEVKKIAVKKAFENIANGFDFILSTYHIDIDLSQISSVSQSPRMSEAEFYTIAVNLISNAVKASIAGNGKKICVQSEKNSGTFTLRVSDQGVGLSPQFWEKVFEPLVVDPEEKIYTSLKVKLRDEELLSLGKGSGLGLQIVRSIAEKKGGAVQFVKAKSPWKTCVEFCLPTGKE